jgi:Skp family chaperone for outer membrane proteins
LPSSIVDPPSSISIEHRTLPIPRQDDGLISAPNLIPHPFPPDRKSLTNCKNPRELPDANGPGWSILVASDDRPPSIPQVSQRDAAIDRSEPPTRLEPTSRGLVLTEFDGYAKYAADFNPPTPQPEPLTTPAPHDAGQSVKQRSAKTVRKVIFPLVLSAVAITVCAAPQAVQAQNQKTVPHKVGLIDMAHIFKNYKKFTDLREDLKKEIESSDARSKQMVAQIQALQKKMKNPMFAKDSPQQKQWRAQVIDLTGKYQLFHQQEQERFLDKEAQIYKTVYLEVTDAVAIYAKYYKFTLIIRWNKAGVRSAKDPKTILSGMNRLVIYSQPGDDITGEILKHLNGQYTKTARR